MLISLICHFPQDRRLLFSVNLLRRLTVILFFLLSGTHVPASPQYAAFEREPVRHALVIGNSDYHHLGVLPSASLDGVEIAERLRDLNFRVTHISNLTSARQFEDDVLPAFRRYVEPGDLVVFYFSGHGFSYGPTNFLAPIDLPVNLKESDVPTRAIALESIETYLTSRQPGLVLMVIDACRTIGGFVITDKDNNEYLHKGVVQPRRLQLTVNTMVAFASRPGYAALASTAPDQLSIFTSNLVQHVVREGTGFEQIMMDIGANVSLATNGKQQPGLELWSYTSLYLRPTTEVLAQQEVAWNAALESRVHDTIRLFSMRHSVSRYASAARKWLDDHPDSARAPRYSFISPAAVERAWARVTSDAVVASASRAAIVPLATPFAFTRSIGEEAIDNVDLLSDGLLGLVASGSPPAPPTQDTIDRELQAIVAHSHVVTTRPLIARSTPSNDNLETFAVPAGSSIKASAFKDLGRRGQWIQAEIPGIGRHLYVPVQVIGVGAPPVELGRPLLEISAPSLRFGIPDLVDETPIAAAIQSLTDKGRTVTWVSVATASSPEKNEADARTLRRSHVEYVLKKSGIDGRRITSVANSDDIPDGGVRLRFFGY